MYSVYQVNSGETIESIADKLNMPVNELVMLNSLTEQVVPGQLIVIPKRNTSIFDTYVIQKGDNLYEIARKYNVNVRDLEKINGLEEDDYIYPNQEILIPKQGVGIYVTVDNETLEDISKKIGIRPEVIMDQNDKLYLLPDQLIVYKKS